MQTAALFKTKQVYSFEIFPPKRTAPIQDVYKSLDKLAALHPDYISVTYGAGGSLNSNSTVQLASDVKHSYGIESVAHLPCYPLTRADVRNLCQNLKAKGIENILALRGDIGSNEFGGDFLHAADVIPVIRECGDFNIIVAGYPEGHPEASDIISDIKYLKEKVDKGATQIITQLFFDNEYFYNFVERARCAGITVPIEAGIMPVINKKQIERMITLCKVNLPRKYVKMMEKFKNRPEAMRDAAIAYAVDQIVDLAAQDVDGVHLYTMNNPFIATRITEATASLYK